MNAALVGMPGCGKSTVGRLLARRLDVPFIDSDQVIERHLGCSIREFFDREGEAKFRDLEQEVLRDIVQGQHGILSTGGGSVLRPANREQLRRFGQVVYLRSTPEELYRRLRHDQNRPLLQVGDPLAKLRELFATRDPLYRETCHFTVDTGRPSIPTLVNTIAMQFEMARQH